MMLTMMMLMMVVVTMMTMMMATMRTMVVKMMMLMMMLTLALPERLQLERGDLIFGNCHCFRQLSPCPVHSSC